MSNDHTNDDIDLRFALQVTGFELATEPPAPDTPLARVLAFAAEHGHDALTEEHIDLAQRGLL
ncbi:hypothetical protein ACFYWP_01660 [Actinacidiphila glaucinigra]|uniref:hypothetical protein n=1 Tax=Actinacidiphila glaucinigra TaxID=235986 RepID=UPI0036CA10CE